MARKLKPGEVEVGKKKAKKIKHAKGDKAETVSKVEFDDLKVTLEKAIDTIKVLQGERDDLAKKLVEKPAAAPARSVPVPPTVQEQQKAAPVSTVGPMRFRVTNGNHYEFDPRIKAQRRYVAGQVLSSYRQLDKIFLNKFVQVEDSIPVSTGTLLHPLVETGQAGDGEEPSQPQVEEVIPEEEEVEEVVEGHYELKHEGGSRWQVVPCSEAGEPLGPPVHDGYLTRTQALEMLNNLEAAE